MRKQPHQEKMYDSEQASEFCESAKEEKKREILKSPKRPMSKILTPNVNDTGMSIN